MGQAPFGNPSRLYGLSAPAAARARGASAETSGGRPLDGGEALGKALSVRHVVFDYSSGQKSSAIICSKDHGHAVGNVPSNNPVSPTASMMALP